MPDTRSSSTENEACPVTFARGDGIGPEIMEATLRILEAAGAKLALEEIEVGKKVYEKGITAGIEPRSWESLRRTQVFLKAPITTPQGGGYKSLNVTIRKTLGLYANVRPCVSYHPIVRTQHPTMNMVIVRENEEDTYAGIEHQQTDEVTQCLKLISRPGTERLVRYAFEFARQNGRHKVTCLVKDNIMKITDGLFHQVFKEIGEEYSDLEKESKIIDIGAALIADDPGRFDVVVCPNLYGDIVSDIAAQIGGSVGLVGSSNIGQQCAMFEAIHGSAPDIAGQNRANPSALIQSAVLMLVHIGQADAATKMHNAWLKTLEDGIHTGDIYREESSTRRVGTREFADAVIERLGQEPRMFTAARYEAKDRPALPQIQPTPQRKKTIVGVDVFLHWTGENRDPKALGKQLEAAAGSALKLKMITNRGVKVYPDGFPETFCTDHWRCRFTPAQGETTTHGEIIELLQAIEKAGLDFIKTEHLCAFDGERAYSLGQGE